MEISELKEKVATMPQNPGLYIFKTRLGKKLYLGKATNLKKRLYSYTRTTDSRIRQMISLANFVEVRPTLSDIDALILESLLIKKYQPQFNIMLRDDKQYFYIGFGKEKFPRIFLTHQPNVSTGVFIGPYTEGIVIKTILRFLRKIFPYCTCKESHTVPCLNYHIGKCLGVCCLKNPDKKLLSQNLATYNDNIRAIRLILAGKRLNILKGLNREMRQLASSGNLKEAIKSKNKIRSLERIFENAQSIRNVALYAPDSEVPTSKGAEYLRDLLKMTRIPLRIEGYDIANIQGQYASGSMVVFVHGQMDKNSYRKFNIRSHEGAANDPAMLDEIISRRLKHLEWPLPDLIIVDGGKAQVNAVSTVLKESGYNIKVIGLTKDMHHRGDHIYARLADGKLIPTLLKNMPTETRNLILSVDSEAHRFAISHYRKRHRAGLKF